MCVAVAPINANSEHNLFCLVIAVQKENSAKMSHGWQQKKNNQTTKQSSEPSQGEKNSTRNEI